MTDIPARDEPGKSGTLFCDFAPLNPVSDDEFRRAAIRSVYADYGLAKEDIIEISIDRSLGTARCVGTRGAQERAAVRVCVVYKRKKRRIMET